MKIATLSHRAMGIRLEHGEVPQLFTEDDLAEAAAGGPEQVAALAKEGWLRPCGEYHGTKFYYISEMARVSRHSYVTAEGQRIETTSLRIHK